MPAALLGQNKPAETPEPAEDESTHTTAFLVLIKKDGNIEFQPNINTPVIPEREVRPGEVKATLYALLDEIKAQETAMTIMTMQMQMARQAQEQAQSQQIMQQLQRTPGR
jgi:hypothetical protein